MLECLGWIVDRWVPKIREHRPDLGPHITRHKSSGQLATSIISISSIISIIIENVINSQQTAKSTNFLNRDFINQLEKLCSLIIYPNVPKFITTVPQFHWPVLMFVHI